jgi:hypothetical protein
MATIYFKCGCEKSLAVDQEGAGRKIGCPDCGAPLTVPVPNIYWACECGAIMLAPNALSGQMIQCFDCKAVVQVPVADKSKTTRILIPPPAAGAAPAKCPHCGGAILKTTLVCNHCSKPVHG